MSIHNRMLTADDEPGLTEDDFLGLGRDVAGEAGISARAPLPGIDYEEPSVGQRTLGDYIDPRTGEISDPDAPRLMRSSKEFVNMLRGLDEAGSRDARGRIILGEETQGGPGQAARRFTTPGEEKADFGREGTWDAGQTEAGIDVTPEEME